MTEETKTYRQVQATHGLKGGKAVVKKYGKKYMAKIGRKGGLKSRKVKSNTKKAK